MEAVGVHGEFMRMCEFSLEVAPASYTSIYVYLSSHQLVWLTSLSVYHFCLGGDDLNGSREEAVAFRLSVSMPSHSACNEYSAKRRQ